MQQEILSLPFEVRISSPVLGSSTCSAKKMDDNWIEIWFSTSVRVYDMRSQVHYSTGEISLL